MHGKHTETLPSIRPRGDGLAPLAVIEIPAYGPPQAGFEIMAWLPTQLEPDLGRVDGIAAIVSGPILNERLQSLIGPETAVGDVGADKDKARVSGGTFQILKIAGIRQVIDHDHAVIAASQDKVDEVRSNEAGPASDNHYLHGLLANKHTKKLQQSAW
jgi:hypothetical protein